MDDQERGVALIISNKNFDKPRMKERAGTDLDAFKVYSMLNDLGFEMIIEKNNCTVTEMKEVMKKVAVDSKDCFVCFILSYGEKGYVYGSDGRIQVDEIIKPLKGDLCSSLAGKPKLFFIQTCPPRPVTAHDGGDNGVKTDGVEERRIPVEADFLFVQSNIPGYDVWEKEEKNPSLFIEKLVDAVLEYRSHLDVLSILTRMNKEVAKAFHDKAIKNRKLPYVSSTLTKNLFLR